MQCLSPSQTRGAGPAVSSLKRWQFENRLITGYRRWKRGIKISLTAACDGWIKRVAHFLSRVEETLTYDLGPDPPSRRPH